jgi:hypothetical protein
MSPAFCGAFSVAIGSLVAVGQWVAVEMNAVAGTGCGRMRGWGGFVGGCGRAPLGPSPIPYLLREGNALQHIMHCRYSCLFSSGTSPAGTWVFAFLHPSFQQYPLVCQRGHMNDSFHFTRLSVHLPWNVFSHILPSLILNSGTWSLLTSLFLCLRPPLPPSSCPPSPLRFPPPFFLLLLGSFSFPVGSMMAFFGSWVGGLC